MIAPVSCRACPHVSRNVSPNASQNKRHILLAVLTVASIFLLGCTVGPKYARPAVPAPPAFRGADNAPVSSANAGSLGDQNWVEVFHEPELQQLISTALADNFDVRIAAQRMLEQQAQLRITRSQQFPSLSVGGTGIGADLPSSLGSSLPSGTISAGSFNLSAAWVPDFWGLYR
ncbi:MAG: TolC family protein, partial [Acidobacteriaceae bacterium]